MKDGHGFVSWLVFHAQRERDLTRLAMAFKVQEPAWGSHATLVAAGLSSFVQAIDWDLPNVEARFRAWHESAKATHDPALLMLRVTQVKALADMVLRPRRVASAGAAAAHVALDEDRTPAAPLLSRLVGRGLLYRDVQVLANEGVHSPVSARMLPHLSVRDADLYRSRHAELRYVSAREYVEAIDETRRDRHPDVLLREVLEHWSILARLGSFEPPAASATIVRVAALDRDDELGAAALPALEA